VHRFHELHDPRLAFHEQQGIHCGQLRRSAAVAVIRGGLVEGGHHARLFHVPEAEHPLALQRTQAEVVQARGDAAAGQHAQVHEEQHLIAIQTGTAAAAPIVARQVAMSNQK
jgi:hypothetical protein